MTRWIRAIVAGLTALVSCTLGFAYFAKPGSRPVSPGDGRRPGVAAARAQVPRAVVDQTEYDFGVMDPRTRGEHEFLVKNGGDAPLQLKEGSTTCKCTVAELPGAAVAPGEVGRVRLRWDTASPSRFYSHSAIILTNDPKKKSIQFSIEGLVRAPLGFEPDCIVLPRVEPDKSAEADTIVYSQAWKRFSIAKIKPSLEGLTWKVEPAAPEALSRLDALSGYRLRVRTPAEMAEGPFHAVLHLNVTPNDGAKTQTFELVVQGRVLRRLCLYGREIDGWGVVDLGLIRRGESARAELLMKVCDNQVDLPVRRIETNPSFLQVRVAPYATSDNRLGLYRFIVEAPRDAPACAFTNAHPAQIEIEFNHPRIHELKLTARLIVAGDT